MLNILLIKVLFYLVFCFIMFIIILLYSLVFRTFGAKLFIITIKKIYFIFYRARKICKKHKVETKKNISRNFKNTTLIFLFLLYFFIRLEKVFRAEGKTSQQRKFRKFHDYRVFISLSHFWSLLWFFSRIYDTLFNFYSSSRILSYQLNYLFIVEFHEIVTM